MKSKQNTNKSRIIFECSPALEEQLKELADKEEATMSAVIRKACIEFLSKKTR